MLTHRAETVGAPTRALPAISLVSAADDSAAADAAVDLALAHGASLHAAFLVPSARLGTLAEAEVRYDLVEADLRDALQRTQAAAEAFARRARDAGIPVEVLVISKEDPVCEETLTDVVRLSDLVVLPQPRSGVPSATDDALDVLLTEAGRPCLVIPASGQTRTTFRSVTVGWDGSAPAARALADSLPLLQRAELVEVVRITRDFAPDGPRVAERVRVYLAAHGIDARCRTLVSSLPYAEAVLSHIADTGSDLLVMGAYGHSRLREALVGGASRDILSAMTVPVLMSH